MRQGILVAATSSGGGKTTLSLGLMAALSRRFVVRPFKVGPDYVDTAYHKFVVGRSSYNLDFHTLGEERLKRLYAQKTQSEDMAVVEGVMGLFDGRDVEGSGSSAHVAKALGLPVILVLDAKAMATSAAAVVLGFKEFDPDLNLAGVILNRVSGEGHYGLLKGAIETRTSVSVLGYLPADADISLPERHLGLVPARELPDIKEKFYKLGDTVEEHIDLSKVVEIARKAKTIEIPLKREDKIPGDGIKVAIATDEAFNFYYDGALELMREMGVELIPFSPIRDRELPGEISGLYIGGGFPENFARELSHNESMLSSVKDAIEGGLPTYAEGGGFMYLTGAIEDIDGGFHPMVGIYDMRAEMTDRLQHFGYILAHMDEDNILGERGQILYGHEFHYSKVTGARTNPVFTSKRLRGGDEWRCGYRYKNCLATYLHIDFYRDPKLVGNFISHMKKYREGAKGEKGNDDSGTREQS